MNLKNIQKKPKAKMVPNVEKPLQVWEKVGFVVIFCALLGGIGAFSGFITIISHQVYDFVKETHQPYTKVELSPGGLVDEAMAFPSAIVISPHRDLVEMGVLSITDGDAGTKVYFCSPTIAVHTKKKWCAWELGSKCRFDYQSDGHFEHTVIEGHNIEGSTSYHGYQAAFDIFKKCIDDGNAK